MRTGRLILRGRVVALLGALARALGAPELDVLTAVLIEEAPKFHDENIAACEEGYREADSRLRMAVA